MQELSQNEGRPLPVGVNGAVQAVRLHPNAALNQKGAVLPHRLGHKLGQLGLADYAVPLRALRPGVEQGPLHVGLDLVQLADKPAAGIAVQLLADEPGGGDGGLDLVNPALHILPILPLGRPGVGHCAGHGPARPAGQLKQPPLIEAPGGGDALSEEILLVQALQNGLQLPEPGPLAEEVGQLHSGEHQQQGQKQDGQHTGLGAGGPEEEGRHGGADGLDQDAVQPVGQKFPQCHS